MLQVTDLNFLKWLKDQAETNGCQTVFLKHCSDFTHQDQFTSNGQYHSACENNRVMWHVASVA